MNTSKSLDEIIRLLAVWETQAYIKREPDTPMLSRREAKQAIVEAVEGLLPELVQPNWDADSGFCTVCEAFLEDDIYRCYCDIRNEYRLKVLQAIKEWQNHGE